jgi:hypothetical protein
MTFYELVQKRHMVRNFTDEPIAQEAIERILDAVRQRIKVGEFYVDLLAKKDGFYGEGNYFND